MEAVTRLIIENGPLSYAIIIAFVVVMFAWVAVSLNWDTGTSDTDIKKEPVEEEEDDYPANWDDHITCSVPWQELITLTPTQFSSYTEDYTGVWSVTLLNGNSILLPMQYTVILDNSYFTIINKENAK